jgi:hypothetical protein
MAALKPNLKVMKTLEANGILDEDKLNYLIDLSQKKPEAISKLIKEANIDPLDIDVDEADNYTPTSHAISDDEMALDSVLEDIRGNDSFDRTMEVVTKGMDDASKALLVQQPDVIKAIDEHIQTGIYDKIMNVVERDRVLGKLSGLSDIEAYKAVGDSLHSQGLLYDNPGTPVETVPSSSKPDPKIAAKKKAAGAVRSKPATTKQKFDPLSMSDEDFEKVAGSNFY